jgi:hypothetical protein
LTDQTSQKQPSLRLSETAQIRKPKSENVNSRGSGPHGDVG